MRKAVAASLFAAVLAVMGTAQAAETDKVIEYYRRKANVPPQVPITVKSLDKSPIAGAKAGKMDVRGREVGFLLSEDGRYAVFGDLEDLTVDPFKAVMGKIKLEGRPFKGNKDAKVTIVEYSDYQCPFCTRGYTTIENEVLKEYGDKVKFYYKNFPLAFHKWAQPAAVAAECAADQNHEAYWTLYKFYFESQKDITPENIKAKTAEALKGSKIDMKKFDECVAGNKTLDRVNADMQEGQSVGVTGTPGFIINGRLVSGAQPFQNFKAIIDDELARAK